MNQKHCGKKWGNKALRSYWQELKNGYKQKQEPWESWLITQEKNGEEFFFSWGM